MEEFMLTLKRSATILHALFTSQCTLQKTNLCNRQDIPEVLDQCKVPSLVRGEENNPVDYPSAIKEFFARKMVGDNACLGEFTNMGNQIKVKKLRSHLPCGGPIRAIADTRNKKNQ